MKQSLNIIITALLVIVALNSCNKGETELTNEKSEVRHYIRFGGLTLNKDSRAIIDSDESGLTTQDVDGIKVIRAADSENPKWNKDEADLTIYSCKLLKKTGLFSGIPELYPDKVTGNAAFMAYYLPTSIKIVGGKLNNYQNAGNVDIMIASPVKTTYVGSVPQCKFTFEHKLSQVELIVKADVDAIRQYGKIHIAQLSSIKSINIDLTTQSVSGSNSVLGSIDFYDPTGTSLVRDTEMKPTPEGVSIGRSLALPGNLDGIWIEFENRDRTLYKLTSPLTLFAGQRHKITATVTAMGVNFTSTIAPWINDSKDYVAE